VGEETNTPSYIYKAAVVNENQALDFLWMGNGESSSRETTDGVADEDCRWKIEGGDDVFEDVGKESCCWLLVYWTTGLAMPGPADGNGLVVK